MERFGGPPTPRRHPLFAEDDSEDEYEEEYSEEEGQRHFRLSQEYERLRGVAGRWSCPSCTFINDVQLQICQVCGRRKGRQGEPEEQRSSKEEVHMFSWDVFSSLADEVVLCVFSHLNLEGLCCVSAVCRRWKRLADDDSLWNSLLYRVIPKAHLHVDLDDELQEHKRDAIYYNSAEGRRLKAASLDKLIDLITPVGDETGCTHISFYLMRMKVKVMEELTFRWMASAHFSAGDINEQKAFLATYLSFTTPEKLLVRLVRLYLHVCKKAKRVKWSQGKDEAIRPSTQNDKQSENGRHDRTSTTNTTKEEEGSVWNESKPRSRGQSTGSYWAPYSGGAVKRKASLIGLKEKKEESPDNQTAHSTAMDTAATTTNETTPRLGTTDPEAESEPVESMEGTKDTTQEGPCGDSAEADDQSQSQSQTSIQIDGNEDTLNEDTGQGPSQESNALDPNTDLEPLRDDPLEAQAKDNLTTSQKAEKLMAPTWLSAHLPEDTEEKPTSPAPGGFLSTPLSEGSFNVRVRDRSRSAGIACSRRSSQIGREGDIFLAEWRLREKAKAEGRVESRPDLEAESNAYDEPAEEFNRAERFPADRCRWRSISGVNSPLAMHAGAADPSLSSSAVLIRRSTSGSLHRSTEPDFSRRYSCLGSSAVITSQAGFRKHEDRPTEIFAKQVRICSLLKKWIEQHFSDFSPRVIYMMKVFIRGTIIRERNPMNAPLANSILRQGSAGIQSNASIFMELPPEPIVPSNICSPTLSLFDVPPIEVARQLTIIEFSRFRAIKMSELFGQLWSRSPGSLKDKAPNVMVMINAFNAFCNWVAASIVSQERIKDRVKIMEFFVQTAKYLYLLKNFNTLMALLAGLRSESVYRLTYTRAEISRKSEKTLENLNQLMRGDNAYKTYREALSQSTPPCIPYLGVHLSDLTFIEDGNPDKIEGLINFTKRRLVFRVISELSRYQQTEYNLHPVPQVIALLKSEGGRFGRSAPLIPAENLYDISERREPRGAERKDIL